MGDEAALGRLTQTSDGRRDGAILSTSHGDGGMLQRAHASLSRGGISRLPIGN